MRMFTLNLLLALVWVFVTEWFNLGNLVVGFLVGCGLLLFAVRTRESARYGRRLWGTLTFSVFYLREVIMANVRLAYYTVMPLNRMKTAIIAVPLKPMSDMERFFLTNFITFTPGTLTVDVSEDGSVAYVHTMYYQDEETFRKEIKDTFESRMLELTQ